MKRGEFAKSLSYITAALGAGVSPALAESQRFSPITIGLVPALRPLNMVRALGTLERAGVPVKWVEFETVPPLATAMVAGAVDMGEADTSGIFAVLSKAPGVAWYVASVTANYVAFVARTGAKITKVADIKGKTIATSGPNTAPQVVMELAMRKAGLVPSDATFFTAPGSNHQALMEKGAVDGAISYVPFTSQMILSKVGQLIFTASDVYGKPWPGGGNFVRQAFAKDHGDEVTEVLRHVQRAQAVIRSHPKDTAVALAKLLQIDEATVSYSYEKKFVTELPLLPDMHALLEQAELLHGAGLLKVEPKPFLTDLINPSFALAAAKKH